MKTYYKYIALLFLVPAISFANGGKLKGKYTKEKTIQKEFTVNPNAGLKVVNSYGNIDMVTWSENRTVIEVTIISNGNDEEKVQERLRQIDVSFEANASLVEAITKFGNKKSTWKWWENNNQHTKIEVNYKIKLPIGNSVNLHNDYGTVSLNKLEGHAKIYCDYGQFIIGELLAEDNHLNFDYTNNSTIDYMKSGKIIADYSSFSLAKAEKIEMVADYTKAEIKEVNNINYNCDYGKVTIDRVNTLMGRGDYVTSRIGTVSGSLNINTSYGAVDVEYFKESTKNITIRTEYTNIKLGIDTQYHFNFDISTVYSSLKGQDLFTINHKKENSGRNSNYKGFHGSENSGNLVNINSTYGNINFIKK